MSTLGIVMLVHTAFGRAEQVARHWAAAGCPVVIHVDRAVPRAAHDAFKAALADLPDLRFAPRHRCEWGTWGIVAATQGACAILLREFAGVRHVYLASGSCLPLRPVLELVAYLDARPQTDFIESATTADVPWTIGGLDLERFTLRFPFAWRRHRWLFDTYVALQRRLRVRRRLPEGIVPHMGSQWWCLTRATLSAILDAPDRRAHERYFRRVWIPDESYFQTLARRHARRIESRSLTLSKFDYQGKPHLFYDDHLQLLRRSDCFVARKIWPFADKLYDAFLTDRAGAMTRTEPDPGKIDRIFAKAVERRRHGRPGLYMQSRFPVAGRGGAPTAAPYSVFEGFGDLFEDFEAWLARMTGMQVHGHLFAPDRAEFTDRRPVTSGAISDSAALRDYDKRAFLANLIWNTRGTRQGFQMGPRDHIDEIEWEIAKDPNAQVSVVSGAWAVPLFTSNADFGDIRREAARLQRIESRHLEVLRSPWTKARVRIWTMADFIEAPVEPLQTILGEIGRDDPHALVEAPRMADLAGFGQFLQNLRNEGMHPHLMGDFPVGDGPKAALRDTPRPYLVRS
ncbi:DUF5927 domain-containing protein [Roseovarius sp. D22-M7]|uniref:DUF5927 domain-containing protein n=1 Tax=Roseovarius sp. D22-M7 TaxID=3127116 RepID=UPI00300FF1CF